MVLLAEDRVKSRRNVAIKVGLGTLDHERDYAMNELKILRHLATHD